jgi:uncharacterized protein (TIGR03437 family)
VVKSTVEHLTRAQLAIATKWADGASSPTPPGHWNFIAETYVSNANFTEVRAARAFALLDMAMMDAAISCWDAKYFYFNPRPGQLDPSIRTVIGLPNFPSYTSGHSTFSAAATVVLTYLFPAGADYFNAQAQEAAISRLYGGIHSRSDIEVGLDQGKRVGGYTVRFAERDGADHAPGAAVTTGQLLDAASFHSPVAPGSIAAVFGTGLGASLNLATTVPLPNSLDGVSVKFNGVIPAPIFAAAPNQANIQVPWELQGLSSASLSAVGTNGSLVTAQVPLSTFAPAIFTVNQQGTGQGLVINAATGTVADTSNPASRGAFITIYGIGLGPVNSPPATGAAASDASSPTTSPVSVLLNGTNVPASFAGLAPGLVGVYQVNAQIPDNAPTGSAISLALTVGGVTSNSVTIAIR